MRSKNRNRRPKCDTSPWQTWGVKPAARGPADFSFWGAGPGPRGAKDNMSLKSRNSSWQTAETPLPGGHAGSAFSGLGAHTPSLGFGDAQSLPGNPKCIEPAANCRSQPAFVGQGKNIFLRGAGGRPFFISDPHKNHFCWSSRGGYRFIPKGHTLFPRFPFGGSPGEHNPYPSIQNAKPPGILGFPSAGAFAFQGIYDLDFELNVKNRMIYARNLPLPAQESYFSS